MSEGLPEGPNENPPVWELEDGRVVELITADQYENLPDGVTLTCISGKGVIKGTDYVDWDTRGGYIAYGFVKRTPRDPGYGQAS